MSQIHREALTRFEKVTIDYQIPIWKEGSNDDATLKRITLRDFFASDVVTTAVDPPNWATNGLTATGAHTHNLNGHKITLSNGTHEFASNIVFRMMGSMYMPSITQDDALSKVVVVDSSTGQLKWKELTTLPNLASSDLTQAASARTYGMNNQNLTFNNGVFRVTDASTYDMFYLEHGGGDITFGGASGVGTGGSNWIHQTNFNVASSTMWEHKDFGGNAGLKFTNWTQAGGLNHYGTIEYNGPNSLYILQQGGGAIQMGSSDTINIGYGTGTARPVTVRLIAGAGQFEISGANAGVGSTKFRDDTATTAGIEYHADYSADFSARSLIDKGYADATYATGAGITDGDKGDVVVGSSGASWTIDTGVVSNAKLADVATSTFKGRTTAGTGSPEDLTAAQARTILNVEDGATADQTASEIRSLLGNGNFGVVPAAGTAGHFLKHDGTFGLPNYTTNTDTQLSDAEVETAYNNQVAAVSQAEAEAGTSTDIKRWTPQRVKQAIDALASGATNLSEGTTTNTTVDVNSNTGTNATLAAASTSRAGVMSKAKFDEVVANTAKVGLTAGQITILGNTSGTNTGDQDISGIATNTTNIATNTTNIASNDTDIATNVTAIALNTAKVTNATHTGEVTGSGALTIADNVVDEANLKVSNTPTDGHALIARSGESGGMKWEALPGQSTGSGTKVLVKGAMGANQVVGTSSPVVEFVDSGTPAGGAFDVNGEWDNTNHRFTVASSGAGTYSIQAQIFLTNGTAWSTLYLYKNGSVYSAFGGNGTDTTATWDNLDGTIAIDLDVGDYIDIRAYSSANGTISFSSWPTRQAFSIAKIGESVTVNNVVLPSLTKTIILEAPADADYIPIFRTDVAITIQEALGALMEAGDVDVRLYWDTDLANTSPTAIGASTTLTTTTEAAVDISTDPTIPANSWIFLDIGTVATAKTTVVNIRYTE